MLAGQRYVSFALAIAAFPAYARAQVAPRPNEPTPAPPPATASATPDPAQGLGAPIAASADVPASRYPRDVISRPLTYPSGLAAAGFDLSSPTTSLADPATIRLLAGYGITDELELNFGHYMFPTNRAGKGTIDFGAGYAVVRGASDGRLEMIARVQTGYSLASSQLNPLLAGVHAQFNVTPTLGVITPGGQLSIATAGATKPVTFGLPLSLGWQASPIVYVQADTVLATLKIANASNAFLFADSTPITVTAYVNAVHAVDVFAGMWANLTPADTVDASGNTVKGKVADTAGLIVGARYYLGAL
jgi:hypothetical protein